MSAVLTASCMLFRACASHVQHANVLQIMTTLCKICCQDCDESELIKCCNTQCAESFCRACMINGSKIASSCRTCTSHHVRVGVCVCPHCNKALSDALVQESMANQPHSSSSNDDLQQCIITRQSLTQLAYSPAYYTCVTCPQCKSTVTHSRALRIITVVQSCKNCKAMFCTGCKEIIQPSVRDLKSTLELHVALCYQPHLHDEWQDFEHDMFARRIVALPPASRLEYITSPILAEWIRNKMLQASPCCPNCQCPGTIDEESQLCNHITCSVCGQFWCYMCNRIIVVHPEKYRAARRRNPNIVAHMIPRGALRDKIESESPLEGEDLLEMSPNCHYYGTGSRNNVHEQQVQDKFECNSSNNDRVCISLMSDYSQKWAPTVYQDWFDFCSRSKVHSNSSQRPFIMMNQFFLFRHKLVVWLSLVRLISHLSSYRNRSLFALIPQTLMFEGFEPSLCETFRTWLKQSLCTDALHWRRIHQEFMKSNEV